MHVDALFRDVTLAWRNAVRRPGFTLLVVLTLALGIGVNSAVFALLDGLLLRALPYRDPARLVFVWQTMPAQNVLELEATPFDYDAWHALREMSDLAMVVSETFTLTGGDNPERVRGSRVTASLMPMLGIAPRLGRYFTPAEDLDGTAGVVILSDRLWRRRFGSDESVLERVIQVNGEPRTIVGVMPRGASLPGPLAGNDDLWLPARMTPSERSNAQSHSYTILGRLANGANLAQASAEIEAFAARLALEQPSTHGRLGVRLVPIAEQTVHLIKPTLLIIAGSVGLLLLIASANASTLLLARASNRHHEL
ncbi:MAG TPA: ABC transporter permease, partial [Vicinamibacterales bacterium]|nr:ABC transporter permease [Vicinamibacterales bacterium]